ncbi:hypothetical protein DSL92_00525 [Billgrantia gudaonensis]|uniref:Uncharacterized protein n=1 Tax=Billgrantia gudaonensis TaxID=376427 RepID=A0A3S0Q1Q8_9GAMM|nr:hypothetical protein DSL92_00525 [Halomonas gudaonensis]
MAIVRRHVPPAVGADRVGETLSGEQRLLNVGKVPIGVIVEFGTILYGIGARYRPVVGVEQGTRIDLAALHTRFEQLADLRRG